MKVFVLAIQIVFAVGLIGLILLQSSKGGLGGGLGAGEFYRSKRGAERVVFIGTIIMSILFLTASIASLFVR